MKIKEAAYKTCGECGVRKYPALSDDVFGCDNCRKPISFVQNGKTHHDYLELTVFRNPSDTDSERLQFCSWECVLDKLPTIDCDYFIDMPMLYFERNTVKGQHAQDLFRLLKRAR